MSGLSPRCSLNYHYGLCQIVSKSSNLFSTIFPNSINTNHIAFILTGIVSGALLQLSDQFDLSCMEQAVIVSSMLAGAIVGSLLGGN